MSLDFPLDMHQNARRAAGAARCAGDQGLFWELRNVMIVNANELKLENLLTYATDLKLDVDEFRTCVELNKYRAEVPRQARRLNPLLFRAIMRFPCATAWRNNHRHRLRQPSRSYIVGASISSNAFKGNCG